MIGRFLLAALLFVVQPALAQVGGFPPMSAPVTVSSYTGPFNIITSNKLVGVSTRLLDGNYAGKALYVCLTTNHTTCGDVGFDSTTHSLKATDISAVCTAGTNCELKIWYTQDGSGAGSGGTPAGNDLAWTNPTNRPTLVNNCPSSGLYCVRFADASALNIGNSTTQTWNVSSVTSLTAFLVKAERTFTNGVYRSIDISSSTGETVRFDSATSACPSGVTACYRIICFTTACTSLDQVYWNATLNAGVHQVVWWIRNNTTNTVGLSVDQGTAQTINDNMTSIPFVAICVGEAVHSTLGCNTGSGYADDVDFEEIVMFKADNSASITGGISANQKAFWGTP